MIKRNALNIDSGECTEIVRLDSAIIRGIVKKSDMKIISDETRTIDIEITPKEIVENRWYEPERVPMWLIVVSLLIEKGAPILIDVSRTLNGDFTMRQSDVVLCDGWDTVEIDRNILTDSFHYLFRRGNGIFRVCP